MTLIGRCPACKTDAAPVELPPSNFVKCPDGRCQYVHARKDRVVLVGEHAGAVEAERAEILTLLQETADAEPRMSEARIAILAAAKRIHERGR